MTELPAKLLGETRTYTQDFADVLPIGVTISTKSIAATVYSGTDASPSSIVSGSATSSGSIISQKITAGLLGVIYQLLWTITTSDGQTLQKSTLLAIAPNTP